MPYVASMPHDPAPPRPFDGRGGMGGGAPGFGPPQGWLPYWRGERLVDPRVSDADRLIAVAMHLWWLGFFIGGFPFVCFLPVLLWAVRQSSSGFVDDHGREVINVQLTGLLLILSIFGAPFMPFWGIFCAVNSIRGAIAASQREHFRYGMIFRPIG